MISSPERADRQSPSETHAATNGARYNPRRPSPTGGPTQVATESLEPLELLGRRVRFYMQAANRQIAQAISPMVRRHWERVFELFDSAAWAMRAAHEQPRHRAGLERRAVEFAAMGLCAASHPPNDDHHPEDYR